MEITCLINFTLPALPPITSPNKCVFFFLIFLLYQSYHYSDNTQGRNSRFFFSPLKWSTPICPPLNVLYQPLLLYCLTINIMVLMCIFGSLMCVFGSFAQKRMTPHYQQEVCTSQTQFFMPGPCHYFYKDKGI